ncbi:MAG: DNA-binding domain-containing protein [Verrucomicrobiales bacterium]|nr:DNA-binding domain-containing protein [Verrucomicrobiales bacterium]
MNTEAKETAPDLDRVQRWMQAVITHPDGVLSGADGEAARALIDAGRGNLESVVTRSRSLDAADRLAIYANAYYARLIECVGDVYPVLKRILGDEVFDSFAFDYLQTYPSKRYSLNLLGDSFVDFLRETRPDSEDEQEQSDWADLLINLAILEWIIYEVFDGPGTEKAAMLEMSDVEGIEAQQWLQIALQTPPCLKLVALAYPVNTMYTAVRANEDELEVAYPDAVVSYVAISRRDYIVRRYDLTHPQYELLQVLQAGGTIGAALEACMQVVPDEELDQLLVDVQQWFSLWTAERCFFQAIR